MKPLCVCRKSVREEIRRNYLNTGMLVCARLISSILTEFRDRVVLGLSVELEKQSFSGRYSPPPPRNRKRIPVETPKLFC